MSERWITIPPPAEFRDSFTKKKVQVPLEGGNMGDHPDRTFDWFLHVHILSHLQFSHSVGGYDATKAASQIAKSLDKALDEGKSYFGVSADQWRRMNCCNTRADEAHADEGMKEKPNMRTLSLSSQGMTSPLSNFAAQCFMEHLDAIANASTNEPMKDAA